MMQNTNMKKCVQQRQERMREKYFAEWISQIKDKA